jgi:hypothetical protein
MVVQEKRSFLSSTSRHFFFFPQLVLAQSKPKACMKALKMSNLARYQKLQGVLGVPGILAKITQSLSEKWSWGNVFAYRGIIGGL